MSPWTLVFDFIFTAQSNTNFSRSSDASFWKIDYIWQSSHWALPWLDFWSFILAYLLVIALTHRRKDINHSADVWNTPPPLPHQLDTSVHVSNAFLRWNQGWSARFPAKISGISDLLKSPRLRRVIITVLQRVLTIFTEPIALYLLCCFLGCRWCGVRKEKAAGNLGATTRAACRSQLSAGIATKPWQIPFPFFFLKQTFSDSCAFWLSAL